MLTRIKEILIGSPLETRALGDTRLNKIRALATFSPDALSSIAYANQEIYVALVAAGALGLAQAWPIGIAITTLLVIVAISYYQTIFGYPSGGGSYIVAKDNLGKIPGLVAGSALLIGYLLTAAVSLTAGVEAMASAFPFLWEYRVWASLLLLLIITLMNLRGLQETGTLMSFPVYIFLFTYLPMIAYGVIKLAAHGVDIFPAAELVPRSPLTPFMVLHAFATGCTALTGIEAISNGVPAFKPPESKNAGRTLIVMALLMGVLFLGSIGLTTFLGVVAGEQETILSALARRLFGDGFLHILIQFTTMIVLAVAANTSFAGFPRLAAILANDGFLPRQFTSLGDRLVYANGITALSVVTGFLIILFNGDSHSLVPLFAVGVFLAFTLSQTGMVIHWRREDGKGWLTKAGINGLGALATGITLLIVGIGNFLSGAWITILAIPLLVILFLRIQRHYSEVGKSLTLRGLPPSLRVPPPPRIVIPISGVHRGTIDAITYAESICRQITAVYVETDPERTAKVLKDWNAWFPDIPLKIVSSPYRSLVGPLLDFLEETDQEHNDGQLATVILPEFVPAKWWQGLLHNQTAFFLRNAILYSRRQHGIHKRVIIDVPFYLRK